MNPAFLFLRWYDPLALSLQSRAGQSDPCRKGKGRKGTGRQPAVRRADGQLARFLSSHGLSSQQPATNPSWPGRLANASPVLFLVDRRSSDHIHLSRLDYVLSPSSAAHQQLLATQLARNASTKRLATSLELCHLRSCSLHLRACMPMSYACRN
jgi:hypothetical protein